MYVFAIATLLGLGVAVAATFVDRYLDALSLSQVRPALGLALGVAAAWLAGFNLWTAWGVDLRWQWVGVTMTGFVLAGAAQAWHAVLALAEGLGRKANDEANTLEQAESLRSVA
ncbi:MAG: hypothetical protein HOQ24_11370 [Mycobacteriaceae bacterium]|nr:hypothetical protein [Mycobacteriaceae bacterium]